MSATITSKPFDLSGTDKPRMPRIWSLETDDFGEIATCFPGWDQRYTQLGRGPFRGRVLLAQIGRFQLFELEGNRSILARGESPRGCYVFSPVQDRNAGALWRGRNLRPGMINIRKPGEPMDHRTSEDYLTTGLIVDARFVRRVADSLHGVDVETILRGPDAMIDRERCVSLDRSLRRILRRLAQGVDAPVSELRVEESLIDWLSVTLGHMLPERLGEPPGLGHQRRSQVVRQAEEYMLAYLDRPISLLKICEAIGVSERTLLYAFRERTGLSPKAYLKALKLNRVRQDLKEADPDTQSVHQIAERWGLEHSGALAADYRRLFGERPGQTLQRRR